MFKKITKEHIETARKKIHSIPETHGKLIILTALYRIVIEEVAISIHTIEGNDMGIHFDVSGRYDGRKFEEIELGTDGDECNLLMPYPTHWITVPLNSITSITWGQPLDDDYSLTEIYQRRQQ